MVFFQTKILHITDLTKAPISRNSLELQMLEDCLENQEETLFSIKTLLESKFH